MCKFIGKSNERVLCKLSKKEILRLYSIVHVAMETTKTSNFNRLSKSFISIFFTCQVSACELQPFSCYDLANDIYLQTAKTVFSHLKSTNYWYKNWIYKCFLKALITSSAQLFWFNMLYWFWLFVIFSLEPRTDHDIYGRISTF